MYKGVVYQPKIWGNAGWTMMHTATFHYSEKPDKDEKQRMKIFLIVMPFMLPCGICGVEFAKHVNELKDSDLASRKAISSWLVKVHNKVNLRLGKPIMTYEEAEQHYLHKANIPLTCAEIFAYLFGVLLLCALGVIGWLVWERAKNKYIAARGDF